MARLPVIGGTILVALLGACSHDSEAVPNPTIQFMPGKWDVSFSVLITDDISCRLPTTVLTVEQSQTELSGSFEGYGSGVCTALGVDLAAPMGAGPLVGTAGDGVASLFLRGPTFYLVGAPTPQGLAGSVYRSIPYGGPVPLYPFGTWQATPHPTTVPAGSAEFIRIDPDPLWLSVIDSQQLTITVLGHDRQPLATQPAVVLTSSDTAVANVSPTGWLHAGSHHGMFTITGQSGATFAQAVGVVRSLPTRLFIEPQRLDLNRMSVAGVDGYPTDAAGNQLPGVLTRRSSDTAIATIDENGFVHASDIHLGSAWIRFSASGLTDSIPVHVVAIPVTLAVAPHTAVLAPGGHIQLQLEVRDSAGLAVPNPAIQIVSDHPAVVAVTSSGLVTSEGPLGFATIVASVGGLVDTLRVVVRSAAAPAVVDSVYLGSGTSPFSVAVAANGSMLVGDVAGFGVFRGDLPSHQFPTRLATGGQIFGVALNPDGSRGYIASDSTGTVLVISTATNEVIDSIPALPIPGPVNAIAVSPDNRTLAVSQSTHLRLFDAVTLAPLADIMLQHPTPRLTFHPSQPFLYASDYLVEEIDLTTRTVRRVLGEWQPFGAPWGSAVSADGTELYVSDVSFGLRVYDLSSGRLKDSEALVPEVAYGLALSTTQDLIYLTTGDVGKVVIFDRASRVPIATLSIGGAFQVSLDAAGTTALVPSSNGWVYFIR
jgi:DNA-binding beta-propeller fold protein YncE